jgi:CTP synthase (UTP-ammonia lyase)
MTNTIDEKQHGEFHNPNVQITNRREIAARGLTPNHLHKVTWVEVGGIIGKLHSFEHFDATSVIAIWRDGTGPLVTVDVPHLQPIFVDD